MKDLKPFIPAGKIECPKCLNGYMELKLYGIDEEEYIEVICGGCGYTWNMATADAGEKPQVILEKKEEPVEGEKELIVEAPEVVDEELTNKLKLTEDKKAEMALEGIAKVEDDETKEAPVEEKE